MSIRSFKTSSIRTGEKRSKFWDQSAVIVNGAFVPIASVTLGSVASSITLSSIPTTYQHLQFRFRIRNTGGGACDLNLRANGATGSVYSYHYLNGTGAAVSADGGATQDRIYNDGGSISGATGIWSVGVLDLHDYASTSKNKTFRMFFGYDANGFGRTTLSSGLYQATTAVTSVEFFNNAGYNWDAGSTVALYGIKGA